MTSSLTEVIASRVRLELARRAALDVSNRSAYSQVALAAALDVSQQTVSEKLRGRSPFTLDQLAATAAFLQVELADLLAPEAAAEVVPAGAPA